MTASASHLRLQARLTAYEGETKIFERSFDDEVPRVFV
jgi:hypothetical protein